VLTASGLLVPSLFVVAVSAIAMGVEFSVHMLTHCNSTFLLPDRLGLI